MICRELEFNEAGDAVRFKKPAEPTTGFDLVQAKAVQRCATGKTDESVDLAVNRLLALRSVARLVRKARGRK